MSLSRFQLGLAGGLLALLATLAVLQVVWLGRISEAEKDRMSRRLETDTGRFTEDFNREISKAYSIFQVEPTVWKERNWATFAARDDFWRSGAAYPELIREFYYVPLGANEPILRYDRSSRTFVEAPMTNDATALTAGLRSEGHPASVDPAHSALRIVFFDGDAPLSRIVMQRVVDGSNAAPKLSFPDMTGVLVVALDENLIRDRMLPDLVAKHFPDGDYNVAVLSGERPVFGRPPTAAPDNLTPLFAVMPDGMTFVTGPDGKSSASVKMSSVIVNQSNTIRRFETRTVDAPQTVPPSNTRIEVRASAPGPDLVRSALAAAPGQSWKLLVTHRAGSVDAFTTATKWRNLTVTFGLLALLGVCVVAIFVSTQRARLFAQRQVDFVSSVSHEFRTPLAVIFSAGENLADGVAAERAQVERYGLLIKNEGRKLSAMVEQILEFAGANSKRRKLDLNVVDAATIIEHSLAESSTLLDEHGFSVETESAADTPAIRAEPAALSRAVQNLIANAVKYSNGSRWIRVGVKTVGNDVAFFVEDRGLGISPDDQRKIFEPFYRSRSVVDSQISGNGLGLSLVSETVREHGGTVGVESELGRGSTFTIRIPSARRELA